MKKTLRSAPLLFFLMTLSFVTLASDTVNIISPDGNVRARIFLFDNGRLGYAVTFQRNPVIESSLLGLTVENVDLGDGVTVGEAESYEINETYPWRGAHATAVNHGNGTKISLLHTGSDTKYTLDVRAYNDGIALQYMVPGTGSRVISQEATTFTMPPGSKVWYHDFYMHYEGQHEKKDISEIKQGEWMAPPLTVELPNEQGYAAITEAAIINFSGMGLQANGNRGFEVQLGHETEVSYPYVLRYGEEDAERLSAPAAIEGTIATPWRVIMLGADLNTLFNCDMIHNLSPAPDQTLFPNGFNETWLQPGRAVWGYLTDEPRTLEGMKNLSRQAGELGFEYHIVEGHWQRWSVAERKDLVDYSHQQNVKLLFWKHSKDLRDPEKRHEFFQHLHELGVAGAKIDFFDHEAKEIIDLYYACLKEAAEYQLILDFHGANKPTGESRPWPNEMTREAIKGFEMRGPWAQHNATLPFTRMLAGHADYTPLHFGDRRCETSETHQIASAIVLQAPLLVYAEHPENILQHKAVDIIKQIPSVWDETIVLPGSEIGKVAAFARRKGDQWFISVMNGEEGRFLKIDLSFLGEGEYTATMVRDEKPNAAMVSLIRERLSYGAQKGVIIDNAMVKSNESLVVELIPGGGFVAIIQ